MSGKFVSTVKICVWLGLILAAGTCFVPQIVEGAGIYKWKDDAGRVHFTDSPQKIPEKYRSSGKAKKMPFRALPAPAMKPMPGAGDASATDSKTAPKPGEPGADQSGEEAKMIQETIGFLNQDIARYKKYEDFVPQRRSAILLRNEVVGALPAKEALAKKLEASQSASLQAAKSYLKASIAKDLEMKKQEYPKRLVFIGERTRINGENALKVSLIEQLKSELNAAQDTAVQTPPPAIASDAGAEAAPPVEPQGSKSKGSYY